MYRANFRRFLLVVLVFCLLGEGYYCRASAVSSNASISVSHADVKEYVQDTNQFGLKLFQSLATHQAGNVFISPFSVAQALQMVYAGSGATTRQEMAKTLNLVGMTDLQLDQSSAYVTKLMETPQTNVMLSVADALWANQTTTFNPAYLATLQQYFSASVHNSDFSNPATINAINSWCSQKTNGKITQIIDQLNVNSLLVLLNAVYFKGLWTVPFDASQTIPHDFSIDSTTKASVATMINDDTNGDFGYSEGANFQCVKLNYGPQQGMSMYVFLPRPGVTLAAFVSSLTLDTITQSMANLYFPNELILRLPKFKTEYGAELSGQLSQLGMSSAFDPTRSDFRNMIVSGKNQKPYINKVLHKSYIDVDEAGTEAAAVTAVEMEAGSAMMEAAPPPPVIVDCNRPFFYLIQDNRNGAILFMGTLVDPRS